MLKWGSEMNIEDIIEDILNESEEITDLKEQLALSQQAERDAVENWKLDQVRIDAGVQTVRELTEQLAAKDAEISIFLDNGTSGYCRARHVQACHICEDAECLDNLNPKIKSLREAGRAPGLPPWRVLMMNWLKNAKKDGWEGAELVVYTSDEFLIRVTVAEQLCAALGRDPETRRSAG